MSLFTLLWHGSGRGASRASGARPAARADASGAPESDVLTRVPVVRRVVVLAFISYFVVVPLATSAWRKPHPTAIFMLTGAVAFIAIVTWVILIPVQPESRGVPRLWLAAIVTLGIALYVVGAWVVPGNPGSWLTVLAVAAAACGRFTSTVRPAIYGTALCTVAGLAVAVHDHANEGLLATVLVMPPMAAFLAYAAAKRNETLETLRETRAELARVAVSEERLRIARDLHDLLGHSLSLITLKAELSRRMMATDAERAERELADLEAVARQSLSDVREAVAGYRQPDLAAELAAARQLLTAAGIGCRIESPQAGCLPGDVDTVLAWTVREGVTNIVRHARAGTATITIASGPGEAAAEITDDGRCGPDAAVPAPAVPAPRRGGSGLAGLGERVRQLGGELSAGPVRPRGFRLRVTVPLGQGTC